MKSDNVLSANGEDLVNILVNLEETQINISHINKISNDINNTKLGGFFTPISITNDKPYINNATLTDQGWISGVLGGVWEKGLDFAPVQKTPNEPEIRKDFEEFFCQRRCKVM